MSTNLLSTESESQTSTPSLLPAPMMELSRSGTARKWRARRLPQGILYSNVNLFFRSMNFLGCCIRIDMMTILYMLISGLCWHILGLEVMWKHWRFARGRITLQSHQIMVPSNSLQSRQTSLPNHPKSSPVRQGVYGSYKHLLIPEYDFCHTRIVHMSMALFIPSIKMQKTYYCSQMVFKCVSFVNFQIVLW